MCCLFGIIDYNNTLSLKQKERILKVLSNECEARGTDATGIAYNHNGEMIIHKKPLPAHKMRFKLKGNPSVIMGHTRMTTKGNEKNNINNHPFYSEKHNFALAHNGVLYNDELLRKTEKIPVPKIETDSYIALQLIEKKKALNFETIKYMAEQVEGSFCFAILNNKNELFIVKGDNPMCIVRFNGFYIYVSTEAILTKALKKLNLKNYKEVNITDGEIFKFNTNGKITKGEFDIFKSYGFYSYPYFGYTKKKLNYESEYLNDLIYYGKTVGVDEETISELIDSGYDYMDIEEFLYETEFYREDDMYAEI